jgi:hypothetical protein
MFNVNSLVWISWNFLNINDTNHDIALAYSSFPSILSKICVKDTKYSS